MFTCIFPYKSTSKSALALSKEMGAPFHPHDIKAYPHTVCTMINWGVGSPEKFPSDNKWKIINEPKAVAKAINKLDSFNAFKEKGVSTPEWTTNFGTAMLWLLHKHTIFARMELEGHDGSGIVVLEDVNDLANNTQVVKAQLFTKLVEAKEEYRVNTTADKCIGVQRKVPISDIQFGHPSLKTGGNGYGFDLVSDPPVGLRPLAKEAVKALGLDFGGVDIILGTDDKYYVLEVNTAPELTPAMVKGYATELKKLV